MTIRNLLPRLFLSMSLYFVVQSLHAAEDGYRYMHVTIDTPWTIFLFLLVIVLFPFVLMAILYWYFAFKSDKDKTEGDVATKPDVDVSE